MAGITFRDRKHQRSIDADFTLYERDQVGDVSTYQIGDVVGVCFADQHAKQKAIIKHCPVGFGFNYGDEGFIQVLCVVVQRHHSILWKSIGRFEEIPGCGIVLEAKSGYWEDVLRWIIVDEKPEWVPSV